MQSFRHVLDAVSSRVATIAGHGYVQLLVLLGSGIWMIVGGSEAALASTMTIGSFILTQMVLNQQRRREDALHLKIDELIRAVEGARDEVAGSENATEGELHQLRHTAGDR